MLRVHRFESVETPPDESVFEENTVTDTYLWCITRDQTKRQRLKVMTVFINYTGINYVGYTENL